MSSKRQEQAKLIDKLSKKKDKDGSGGCHFQKAEIEKLLSMYNKYVEGATNKKLDRMKFRDILHNMFGMTDDMLMDRVFRAFDRDSDNHINQDEWVLGLSVFLKGDIEELTKYTFMTYDLNQDGYISREEMYQLLKNSMVKQPTEEDPEEGIKELVEICVKMMDLDHDSRLSYADFEQAIKDEPLLLEAFGTCLPSPMKRQCFLNLISDEYNQKY
ncbi:calaxin-like [Ruditapes philippinarum]|uniref:calaxin-like n=1 Tax=Ruditapes philippinarum TaxID=129788 RepID=UPI00295A7735|nr:calaxin-like [Ruditapes philippinarum]